MSLYEYYCEDCHGVFELLRPPREASTNQPCPECDADAKRIVSDFQAFVFRDGYPRKIPDDGTHWHLGTKVKESINKAVQPTKYAGTNVSAIGAEGTASDLKGKPKVLTFGDVFDGNPHG